MKNAEAAYLEAEYGDVGKGDWPPMPRRYPRRPWLAIVLSLLVPGLGHVYVGEMRRGLRLWSTIIGLVVVSGWAGLLDRFWGLAVVLVAALGIYLYTVGDAASRARRIERFEPKPYNRWWVYVAFVLFAETVVAPGARFVLPIQSFAYPSSSMEPTIAAGDHLYARTGSFGVDDLERRDVVVFRSVEDPGLSKVFRIVGLPGEVIEIRDKLVYVDGRHLDEPYVRFADPRTDPASRAVPADHRLRDQFGPYRIPERAVFVMGDNRGQSYDSRYLGAVPIDNIYAKPLYVYWNSLHGWKRDLSRIGTSIE